MRLVQSRQGIEKVRLLARVLLYCGGGWHVLLQLALFHADDAFRAPALAQKLAIQGGEEPLLALAGIPQGIAFLRKDGEGLLGEVTGIGFIPREAVGKPIEVGIAGIDDLLEFAWVHRMGSF